MNLCFFICAWIPHNVFNAKICFLKTLEDHHGHVAFIQRLEMFLYLRNNNLTIRS